MLHPLFQFDHRFEIDYLNRSGAGPFEIDRFLPSLSNVSSSGVEKNKTIAPDGRVVGAKKLNGFF